VTGPVIVQQPGAAKRVRPGSLPWGQLRFALATMQWWSTSHPETRRANGPGRSKWDGPPSFRASAAALSEALRALALPQYVIMGHDSGGALARRIAADDARVRGLILMDTDIPDHRSPLLFALLAVCRLPFASTLFPWALQRRAFRRSLLGFGSCFTDPA